MSISHLHTLKLPFSLKQISKIHRTNPRGTQVSNSSTASQSKGLSLVSMQQNMAPSKIRSSTFTVGDSLLSLYPDDIHRRHARELKNVKRILFEKERENSVEGLYMIDMIQRLGIEHSLEEEIQEAVRNHYLKLAPHNNDLQLSQVALQFRLLRQQHCHVDTSVFENFMDKKGRLRQKFWGDVEGLIELFEASQLSSEGEDDLDETGNFTYHLLSSWPSRFHYDHHEANVIANTLKYPIHRNLPRFTPRDFLIPNSRLNNNGWLMTLENLSQINTQIVNSINLKEIYAVSKWWKDLGLAKDMKFARDEPRKRYMWAMACLTDPCFSEERIELTKSISLVYIIDDIFDVYGSMDELTLFVDAVNRWDMAATEQLPDCMKACLKALYDITNEFSIKVQNKHGWNPINTLIKSWRRLCNAFLEEAKWLSSGKLPNGEDYLRNGIVSTGVDVCLVHTFFILGHSITNETEALMDGFPTLISSASTILRLCDDLESAKDDNQVGKDGSYVNCYMKDHPGICVEKAKEHTKQKISEAWKSLNKECFSPTNPFPSSFKKICLNVARMVPIMYSYDGCSPSRLEEHVKSLLDGGGGDGTRKTIQKDQVLML